MFFILWRCRFFALPGFINYEVDYGKTINTLDIKARPALAW
jgi:hypothetical protein